MKKIYLITLFMVLSFSSYAVEGIWDCKAFSNQKEVGTAEIKYSPDSDEYVVVVTFAEVSRTETYTFDINSKEKLAQMTPQEIEIAKRDHPILFRKISQSYYMHTDAGEVVYNPKKRFLTGLGVSYNLKRCDARKL